jgi:hypothetical protein
MYYPKSQIKPNLFTNGGEYILSTTQENYKGPYYEISTGEKYSGNSPGDGPNILLNKNITITSTLNNFSPSSILPPPLIVSNSTIDDQYIPTTPPNDRSIPQYNPTIPTPQDQQQGQFNRYFCKKTNENRYLEIDFNTYNKLISQDPKIAWDLYNPTQIIWLIKGNQEQVYNSNKGFVQSIEQNLLWYGFSQYFKNDFSKYYLGS